VTKNPIPRANLASKIPLKLLEVHERLQLRRDIENEQNNSKQEDEKKYSNDIPFRLRKKLFRYRLVAAPLRHLRKHFRSDFSYFVSFFQISDNIERKSSRKSSPRGKPTPNVLYVGRPHRFEAYLAVEAIKFS
jgi:hypothetical protein